MSLKTLPPTNGTTAKPVETPKNEKAVSTTVKVQPLAVKDETPSIEKRLEKFHQLEKVLERREKIAEAVEELQDFYIAPTGTGCLLKLQDSKGNTFAISHPAVIGEMVGLAKAKLQKELEAIDQEFTFTI